MITHDEVDFQPNAAVRSVSNFVVFSANSPILQLFSVLLWLSLINETISVMTYGGYTMTAVE